MKAFLHDRLYVPRSAVKASKLEANYEITSFDEQMCARCDYKPERVCDACLTCAGFKGRVELWKPAKIGDKKYIGVPAPDWRRAAKLLGVDPDDLNLIDRRPKLRWRSKLKFTGSLYTGKEKKNGVFMTNQVGIVEEWMQYLNRGGGMIRLPPRSGKTYLAVNISCRLRLRTVITASQIDWLVQFCEAYHEMTNLSEIATRKKSPIVLICTRKEVAEDLRRKGIAVQMVKNWKDVPDHADVVLTTYQALIHDPKRISKYVKDKFSFLVVDEAHQAPAAAFSKVIIRIPARVRLGLSATLTRVDHLTEVIPKILGKIRAFSDVEAITPRIMLKETGLKFPPYGQWFRLENALASSTKRNQMIVDQVFTDLRKDDKHCILLPVRRVAQAKLLTQMINAKAEELNDKEDENWPEKVAELFYSGSDRSKVLRLAKAGKRRVIVAIEKIILHGLSVGPWSIVYLGLTPTSNGPRSYQLMRRVATPHPDKPDTFVRWWLDDNPACIGCFRALWFSQIDGILMGLKNKPTPRRYIMSTKTFSRTMEITRFPKMYRPPNSKSQLGLGGKKWQAPKGHGNAKGFF